MAFVNNSISLYAVKATKLPYSESDDEVQNLESRIDYELLCRDEFDSDDKSFIRSRLIKLDAFVDEDIDSKLDRLSDIYAAMTGK
jgi:hypothetical protein